MEAARSTGSGQQTKLIVRRDDPRGPAVGVPVFNHSLPEEPYKGLQPSPTTVGLAIKGKPKVGLALEPNLEFIPPGTPLQSPL